MKSNLKQNLANVLLGYIKEGKVKLEGTGNLKIFMQNAVLYEVEFNENNEVIRIDLLF